MTVETWLGAGTGGILEVSCSNDMENSLLEREKTFELKGKRIYTYFLFVVIAIKQMYNYA